MLLSPLGFPARLVSCSYYLLSIISLCEGDTFLRLTAHYFKHIIFIRLYNPISDIIRSFRKAL
ncbi:hypothetical protein B8V57_09005 [Streptococcus agalactiae]|nr:hypothetical protein B8V58_06665 [Streptococcus agalactiae]KAF1231836.1 hypothetical protein B8V57_09005 [Streptococcus agalactiae]